jgi:hypothetical protein
MRHFIRHSHALRLVLVGTIAANAAACEMVENQIARLTGGGSSDEEGSGATTAGNGATPAEGSGAAPSGAADPGAVPGTAGAQQAAPEVGRLPDATINASLFANIPNDADIVMAGDATALWTWYAERFPALAQAMEAGSYDAAIQQFLIAEADIPASVVQSIRISRLRRYAVAVWPIDESFVLAVNPEALTTPPAEGAPPAPLSPDSGPVQVAMRNGLVLIGLGSSYTRALNLEPAQRLDFAASWPGGALPANTAFAGILIDGTSIPATAWQELGMTAGIRKGGIAMTSNMGITIALDTDDDSFVRNPIGAAQAFTASQLQTMRGTVPPAYQGWVDYLELVRQALWSRLRVERTGTVTSIRLLEAECGGMVGNVGALIGIGGGIGWAVSSGAAPAPYADVQARTGTCGSMPGPAPHLPLSLTRLAPASNGAIVLADLGGYLRYNLPTAFGVLPVALAPDAISTALGPNPLGLNGIGDAEGSGALAVAMPTGGMGEPTGLAVLPPGTGALIPPVPAGEAVTRVEPGLGWVIGDSEASLARLQSGFESANPWNVVLSTLPADSVIGAAVDRPILALVPTAGMTGGLVDLLNATQHAALGVDARMIPTFRFRVSGDATALAAAAATDFTAKLNQLVATLPPEEQAMIRMSLDMYTRAIRFTAIDPATVAVSLDLSALGVEGLNLGGFVLGGALIGAGAAMGGAMNPFGTPVATGGDVDMNLSMIGSMANVYWMTERVGTDGKALPQEFPPSGGPVPSLAEISASCAMGGVNVPAGAWQSPPWDALFFQTYGPTQYAYQFESSGVGADATFTASAMGDIDCDSVYSMRRITGRVENGFVSTSAVEVINGAE